MKKFDPINIDVFLESCEDLFWKKKSLEKSWIKYSRFWHNHFFCSDLVSGLAHLHELGIIHRDLKPQNVLIIKGRSLCAKLSDMGISKRLQGDKSSITQHATGKCRNYLNGHVHWVRGKHVLDMVIRPVWMSSNDEMWWVWIWKQPGIIH